jgi:hypothetical protein
MAQQEHGGGFSLDASARIAATCDPPPGDPPDAGAGGCDSHAQPAPENEFDQRVAW